MVLLEVPPWGEWRTVYRYAHWTLTYGYNPEEMDPVELGSRGTNPNVEELSD